ncbi:CBS domain-containing protein/sporulation protein YlmC with PRC-barrel domain [Clostridium saccharoperbutylacetonicum]|uniref:Mg/Co/Ni transporter MgtE n=1 Tax=Clostridium saccharoperbutylacetonicum N1-4(HMT) TaxID=931276 RepID=M1ML04_9CLOT|nr:CBS domain-containing protein [Clostridium saccharoperbutylacetonicum]AGF55486.1 Mg/Co/Ni transporter MgtE [Clostridium saccharoperbutylacetonicum N1-4(HMT)]NRT63796.1 CBS domain-containing protein/sporulation protein YlmC with PRC-barrel domain [Clostridium saccharoperbutylacetonicum]NSB27159.1 CBS domain-containing protein/sporulation protein YlmC with PRC-barrel domain [Clostridium saccharoperbutylacetonicum]NSB40645.1 CBS domain-containing protein/sporulation protein YlmC with PRC-barrel
MKRTTNFFFSKILNKEVHNISDQTIGKLKDFVLDFNKEKPTIVYVQIISGRKSFYISAEALDVFKDDREKYYIKINSESLVMKFPNEKDVFLVRDFLDKQIVDINGRKVERVNDVRLGNINSLWQIVAVDIGTRGLLRRLGIEYPFIKVIETFNYRLRNKLIIWNDVQTLSTDINNLQLHMPANKIETLHAADIADIIEDLDTKSRDILFHSLNNQKAAEVLEEIETDVQVNILKSMSDEKASDILEIMPSDEIADILEEIEEDRAEKLLTHLDEESQDEIRELMEYEKETVGSIMSKDFLTFLPDLTVSDVLKWIEDNTPDDEEGYYIYITNDKENLIGMISLFSLITSNKNDKLYNIMNTRPQSLHDTDEIEDAISLMHKYNLVCVPVMDEENYLVGVVSLNDSIHEYKQLRRVVL